jgi:hypothetical protein
MPTFKKRPEIVDARKFEGGGQNGTDLVFWVNSNEGRAFWVDVATEQIRLYFDLYGKAYDIAYVGDWIMHNQDGTFKVVRQQELDANYEQV